MLYKVYFIILSTFAALLLTTDGYRFSGKERIPRSIDDVHNTSNASYFLHQNRFTRGIPHIDKSGAHRKKLLQALRNSFGTKNKHFDVEDYDRMYPVIKGREYVFSHDPARKDLYLYNEYFNPTEFKDLYLNYFNPWFDENFDVDDHSRAKRSVNPYSGMNPDMQFTSDDIDEYVNLKTHKVYKRKPENLNEAFERVEKDLAELLKMKCNRSILGAGQSKLTIEPKRGDIELDADMPTDVEHLDRHISEEVIRVYIPKKRNAQIKPERMTQESMHPQRNWYNRQSREAGNRSFDSNNFSSELEQEKFFSNVVDRLKLAEPLQNSTHYNIRPYY